MAKLPKNVTRIIIGAVIVAIVAVGAYFVFFNGSSTKKVTAQFASAIGIYSGTPVRILGVNVGQVTGVHPNGANVQVDMEYDSKYDLSPNAFAIEVANSLVSDRYIQLTPLYDAHRDGARPLPNNATIPMPRTEGPAELDQIYASLNKLAVALGPSGANRGGPQTGPLSELLKVAAANLKGNGTAFGNSITKLSQAAQTLANSRTDFFGTIRNLRQFTDALHASDGQIRLFNEQLAQVASDLASERTDLGAALHDLGLALDAVAGFVKQNQAKFHIDIQGLREITSVLVAQKSSLNETFAVAPIALANLVHTYQPDIGAIATRGNLASFSSTKNNDPRNILCSILELTKLDLSKVCPTPGTGGGIPGLSNSTSNDVGVGIPGLIGAGG
jgi:phospholipid/cholesterol/gamma-HCH transport system substrate-binding protein